MEKKTIIIVGEVVGKRNDTAEKKKYEGERREVKYKGGAKNMDKQEFRDRKERTR